MLDYCGEEKFYPIDGDNDCYDSYTPNVSGSDFLLAKKYSTESIQRKKDDFRPDPNYYHSWKTFDKIINREKCYSILIGNTWMNIPKKIVRELKDNEMFVHTPTFYSIANTAFEKQLVSARSFASTDKS